jgi:photosystem II stability/assembly factor-like uncharacterized protein
MNWMIKPLRQLLVLVLIVVLGTGCARSFLPDVSVNPWEAVPLPTEATLSDIAFTKDAKHGWLVGKSSTLLETADGGKTWELRSLDLGDQSYTFTSVSFSGNEGWIVGEPSILLHTTDGGKTWLNVPLSEQLPGFPWVITALGPGQAEMATNVGAIYKTADEGQSWKALVQESVGVVRNMVRSPDGRYVAVSSRGNFYSTWAPGQDAWIQHNRTSSRRLQNMGFSPDGRLWLLARGGLVQFLNSNIESLEQADAWQEPVYPEFSTSWGLLDLAYRNEDELWISGGSANLLYSPDGGETWLKDRDVENLPSNFYRVVFLNADQGFILGQDGVLLRYRQSA